MSRASAARQADDFWPRPHPSIFLQRRSTATRELTTQIGLRHRPSGTIVNEYALFNLIE